MRAAVAVGADGAMVEIHPEPERAWSDGAQSMTLDSFSEMIQDLQPYLELWKDARLKSACVPA